MAEGDNVLFLVHNRPEDIIDITWFKGLGKEKQQIALYVLHKNLSMPGPIHSGREIIYYNGSLLLEKVTQKDSGFYSLRTYTTGRKFISTVPMYLHVHGKLFIENSGSQVRFISLDTYRRVVSAYLPSLCIVSPWWGLNT